MFASRVHRLLAAGLLLLVPALAGCGGSGGPGDVVASFYPLQFVAQRVAGDHLQVSTLTAPGVEPHDLELTVRQRAGLSGARVVLYEKGLQPAVDSAVADAGVDHVVDAASVVRLVHRPGFTGLDPHFWLDPVLLAKVARAFAAEAGDADPEHAADYRANADRLVAQLHRLDRDFREGLARCRIRTLVVGHDAFGYLGARYDLEIVPIAGISPDAEPSPKRLAELAQVARDKGVTTIFSEELASPAMARTLARDLGLRTAVLNPIEGLTDRDKGQDYLSLMHRNLETIRKANHCR